MSFATLLEEYFSEFNRRYANKHFGKFRALVKSIEDPKQLGRIRVICPTLFGDAMSGWCWPASAFGGNSAEQPHGFFALPEIDDMVWIELEEGNTGRPPLWSGGGWSSGAAPAHSRAQPDEADVGIKGIPDMAIPGSAFNASEYGKVRAWQMPSGARLEFDETEGDERIQLFHPSGGHVEILADGTMNLGAAGSMRIQASAGSFYKYVAGMVSEIIDGAFLATVDGEYELNVGKAMRINVGGTFSFDIGGTLLVDHDAETGNVSSTYQATRETVVLGNEYLQVANQMSYTAGSDLYLSAGTKAQLVAQNNVTNGGLPSDLGVELAAYSSRLLAQSTDATGLASAALLEMDGTLALWDADVLIGGTSMSGIHMSGLGMVLVDAATMIQLGSSSAVEPGVLGLTLGSVLSSIFLLIDTHTHLGNLGIPTTPAAAGVPPLATSAAWASGVAVQSMKVFLE